MRRHYPQKTAVGRNWARMAELSRISPRNRVQEAEFQYRIAVQNYFSRHGEIPGDFIEPGGGAKK